MRHRIVATHQPYYMPWPGYFYKIYLSNIFVLLDNVQFPRGASFVNRNRIKVPDKKFLWLTVPVKKKGMGLQRINDVMINNEHNWSRKHFLSLVHAYKKAPYFEKHIGFLENIYKKRWQKIVDLDIVLLQYMIKELGIDVELKLSSELGVDGKGTQILVDICEKLEAEVYLLGISGRKYIEEEMFKNRGIEVKYYNFTPPVYPQLWGDFVPNLSTFDVLFNCGVKSMDIITRQRRQRT